MESSSYIWSLKISLTRPHDDYNHADRDVKFGLLWKAVRNEYLLTPQSLEIDFIVSDALLMVSLKLLVLTFDKNSRIIEKHIDQIISEIFKYNNGRVLKKIYVEIYPLRRFVCIWLLQGYCFAVSATGFCSAL